MKAKLIKKDGHYFLEVEPNTWTPPNRFHSIIANTLDKEEGDVLQLSLKNCQEIELGYDLDELASQKYLIENTGTMYMPNRNEVSNIFRQEGFIAGFQKALELMADKKFTEDDIHQAFFAGERCDRFDLGNILDSRQQIEWDVEIEMECPQCQEWGYISECRNNCNQKFLQPKLDADGCLILTKSEYDEDSTFN